MTNDLTSACNSQLLMCTLHRTITKIISVPWVPINFAPLAYDQLLHDATPDQKYLTLTVISSLDLCIFSIAKLSFNATIYLKLEIVPLSYSQHFTWTANLRKTIACHVVALVLQGNEPKHKDCNFARIQPVPLFGSVLQNQLKFAI